MATVDKPVVYTQEPSFLSIGDCRKLLAAAREHKDGLLLPYVVLSQAGTQRPQKFERRPSRLTSI